MSVQQFQGQLIRSSLGRIGLVGELYDARNESFTSRSLFKSSLPSTMISQHDVHRMDMDYKFTDNISDRFELFQIEGEIQLGVLLGLIKLSGSGKFLTEEKKSEKTVSCTLVCKLSTVNEKLISCFEEILPHIDLTALTEPDYTHVITEATWGANFLLSLESNYRLNSEKQSVKGCLETKICKLKKFLMGETGGSATKTDIDLGQNMNIKVKVCADVTPEKDWPTTVDDFCKFMSDAPKLLQKSNNGKGKPLTYAMIPLSHIRKMAKLTCEVDTTIKKIDESFLISTVFVFEEIAQIKQRFYDTMSEMEESKKYVADEDLKLIKEELQNFLVKESAFKLIISENWCRVKSGERELKDLIKEIERFKHQELNLTKFEDFIDSLIPTKNKLNSIRNWMSEGITYLGKWEKFADILSVSTNFSCEFIVFVTSSEIQKADPELHYNTLVYFQSLVTEKKSNTKYVIIDFDCTKDDSFLNYQITEAKCIHLLGTKILSDDLYLEYISDLNRNFVRLSEEVTVEYIKHRPGKRLELQIPCPGCTKGTCPSEEVLWTCLSCKCTVEYGFDDFYYCKCGRGPVRAYEYRCSSPKHGVLYAQASPDFLQDVLSSLRPLKELNILVLGQSGVGKSTWINSIVNYLAYDSLNLAEESGVICTIPASFTMYDSKTHKKHTIHIGKDSKGENRDVGQSATQESHTYSFLWDKYCVRLIDTPGLGDTRGIQQDQENMANIIQHISHLQELHGVCILLKAGENRIAAFFSYCIKELLIHLHKSVAKNIVFCFTNARTSFYSPGQTSSILEKILESLEITDILALGHHNMFCLDNEAFLFLCSLENPEIQHDEDLKSSFAKSWDISLKESIRLFDTVKSFKPHLLLETISLVKARNRVLLLAKPIAEISKTIQINITLMENKKKELETSELEIEKLVKNLKFPVTILRSEPLLEPRTVCTNVTCIDYIKYPDLDISEVEYKTHCHSQCSLKNITPKTTNNQLLEKCWAMKDGKCRICGCGWEKHMHITVSQKRVSVEMRNKPVEEDLLKTKSEKAEIERFVQGIEKTIQKYKDEQEILVQTSLKFGLFLRQNSIGVYNDSIAEYLKYLIKEEEDKPHKTESEYKLLETLKETLLHYETEAKILLEVINKGSELTEKLSLKDVTDLESQLYNLELTGKSIKESVESSRISLAKMTEYEETTIAIETTRKPRGAKHQLQKNWERLTNFVRPKLNLLGFSS